MTGRINRGPHSDAVVGDADDRIAERHAGHRAASTRSGAGVDIVAAAPATKSVTAVERSAGAAASSGPTAAEIAGVDRAAVGAQEHEVEATRENP